MADDPYGLERFVEAQEDGGIYSRALAELRAGRKQGHWIWFVFPQIGGLGSSPMSRVYAIGSLDEARAYLAHPVLGPRLHECTAALLATGPSLRAEQILGTTDSLKLRSSVTLFSAADPTDKLFESVLSRFYADEPDPETLRRLLAGPSPLGSVRVG